MKMLLLFKNTQLLVNRFGAKGLYKNEFAFIIFISVGYKYFLKLLNYLLKNVIFFHFPI